MEEKTYKVRSESETLWAIARDQLGDPMRYREIKRLNGIGNVIRPGMVLKLYVSNEDGGNLK